MTTRITLAILLTTWVILVIGETAAFWTARESLLVLFDDTLMTRANAVLASRVGADKPTVWPGDRFEIRDAEGNPVQDARGERHVVSMPTIIRSEFETAPNGARVRTIEVQTYVLRDGTRVPYTVKYSRPAERFDWLLSHLAGMLLLISLACGLTTAWLALKLSRAALAPLRQTAETIAGIDEQHLSRRIDAERMPIELKPMAGRLNEMLARLEDVFQQRKQFLADAAHELRTPTAALLTTLEVALRRPRDQAELTAAMQSGLADARRLRKLVESLMEHARSEHVRGPEAMQMTDIPMVLRECVEIVRPLAGEKQIAIEQELPAEFQFVTQRDRLRSVVLNLLSNAIEYNREGGKIRLACTRENGELRLVIADTGQGIAAEQLPHVFEPFYRGGNGRGDDPSHLGLGLFLVRTHVEAMRGKCRIESEVGTGTTMHITLPELADEGAAGDKT